MSSSLAAEKMPLGSRAVQVLTVFSMIGLGNISASIVFLILLAAFESSVKDDIRHLEWVWHHPRRVDRVCSPDDGRDCTVPEMQVSPTDSRTSISNLITADVTSVDGPRPTRGLRQQWTDFYVYFSEWKHAKVLFATAASWFLLYGS